MKGTSHEDRYTVWNTCRAVLRPENIANKCCRETLSTHYVFCGFSSKILPFMRCVIKHCTAGQDTYDNITHAHCMLDTLDYKYTHSRCATLIACPLPQWLHELAPVLRCTCIACLANTAACHAVKKRCRQTLEQAEFRSGLK